MPRHPRSGRPRRPLALSALAVAAALLGACNDPGQGGAGADPSIVNYDGPKVAVTGTITHRQRPATVAGLGADVDAPLSGVVVEVRDAATRVVSWGVTGDD